MSFYNNPYYSPERCGLKIFYDVDIAGSYEFDMFVIWEKLDDGSLWYGQDSGCSCPVPFEGFGSIDDLKPITHDTLYNFTKDLNEFGLDQFEKLNLNKKVQDHLNLKNSNKKINSITIAVDFDGTVVAHKYPLVGETVPNSVEVLKEISTAGHKIILWTMRGNKELEDAVNWYQKNEIELFGINNNPTQHTWTNSNKAYANLYIDDAALGVPLILDDEGNRVVDWLYVKKFLQENNLL